VLSTPRRAGEVRATSPSAFAAAAARNGKSAEALAKVAQDRTLWLDRCGKSFYVEERAAATAGAATANLDNPSGSVPAGVDPLALESRPGSFRTIYLDFRGGTVTGTQWNTDYGRSEIAVAPFSVADTVPETFSAQDLTEIYRTWLVVAEDYAPFDVNVTTKDPGADAIDRTDANDPTYGTRVMVTDSGPIYADCGCGGVAYVNVFDEAGSAHAAYQPAWVFADGTTRDGWMIGQAASHEAGHTFGLAHDGTATAAYYEGSHSWAPIMGASYWSVLTQWSDGQYAGADNTEDDLAIIAGKAPRVPDDHQDTAAGATPLLPSTPVQGLIGTSSDVDAFGFAAGGATTLSATPAGTDTDLDLRLRVYDAGGSLVATVSPHLDGTETAHPAPAALAATWTVDLPVAGTYTALVDGSDNGAALPDQPYDDYGSLGRYRVELTTDTTMTGALTSPPPPTLEVPDQPFSATATEAVDLRLTASGAETDPTWTVAAGALPPGLALSGTGELTGTPTAPGHYAFTARASAGGATGTGNVSVDVAPAPALTILTTSLPRVQAGDPYHAAIRLDGATTATTWSTPSASLPPGLALRPSADGTSAVVSGTPTRAGLYEFRVQADTADGRSAAADYTVRVVPPVTFKTSSALPGGRFRKAYRTAIVLRHPTPGIGWRTVAGALPRGLRLRVSADHARATVAGRPTRRGLWKFRIRVRERDGDTAFRTFRIRIR
jgi:hypothetical protein